MELTGGREAHAVGGTRSLGHVAPVSPVAPGSGRHLPNWVRVQGEPAQTGEGRGQEQDPQEDPNGGGPLGLARGDRDGTGVWRCRAVGRGLSVEQWGHGSVEE